RNPGEEQALSYQILNRDIVDSETVMTNAVELLKPQLERLTPEERAEVARYLLASLEREEEGAEAAWRAEVSRRVADIQAGRASGKPADQLFAELREKYP